jgi:diguanylate cyclase (GGDEF)-like protein
LLSDRFRGAISLARRRGEEVAVYFIDIDKFKTINDTLGHHAGDEVLRAVARRLLDACRASDTVARLGGDEFVVLRSGPLTGAGIDELAIRVRSEIGAPCVVEGMQVNLSVGIGISVFPRDGDDERTLLQNADTALYTAKARGAGSIGRFGVKAAAAIQLGASAGIEPG